MTRTRFSTITYWLLALVFAWGLTVAVIGVFDTPYPTHWRYGIWWAAVLVMHLVRSPFVVLLWIAFFFDMFEPIMAAMYGAQGGLLLFLGFPFYVLGGLIFLWRRREYTRRTPETPI